MYFQNHSRGETVTRINQFPGSLIKRKRFKVEWFFCYPPASLNDNLLYV